MLHTTRPTTTEAEQDGALLAETEARLVARFAADETEAVRVRSAVSEAVQRLSGARIRSFLPILVERSVRLRLTDPV